MIRRREWLTAAALGAAFAAPASAAELAVVGTGDGIEMLQAVSAAFNAGHSDTTVTVPPSIGSGGAVAAVGGDRQTIGRVARPLAESERAQGLVETPLVRIPSVFFVHPDVGVGRLTGEQIAGIFSGAITNWNEVGGSDLRIRVVRREETDSTLSVFRNSMPGWKTLALTPKSKLAMTTQEAVEAVKRVPGAIGFGPYARMLEQGAVVLTVDGRRPHDSDYPSAVTLSLIYKDGRLDADARAFLAFTSSEEVRTVLIADGGIPLTR